MTVVRSFVPLLLYFFVCLFVGFFNFFYLYGFFLICLLYVHFIECLFVHLFFCSFVCLLPWIMSSAAVTDITAVSWWSLVASKLLPERN